MATYYEKSPAKFAVGETVFVNDGGQWVEGEVLEVGDETILVQWQDLPDPTEYEAKEWETIHHHLPAHVVNH